MRYQICGLNIDISNTNIHIENSYRVINDLTKVEIIKRVLILSKFERTTKDLLIEWKAHNILFQRGIKQARTKDVDFERTPNKWHKIGFWLITFLLREKRNG